jgi:hypothetical protein
MYVWVQFTAQLFRLAFQVYSTESLVAGTSVPAAL